LEFEWPVVLISGIKPETEHVGLEGNVAALLPFVPYVGIVGFFLVVLTRKEFPFRGFVEGFLKADLTNLAEFVGWVGLVLYFVYVLWGFLPK
jgi:hypothetical protein